MSAFYKGGQGLMEDAPSPPAPCDESSASVESAADAMSQLFRENNRVLVAYLTNRLRSEQEAKEVAQEAYVRLLELRDRCTPRLLRAYLFKTATNLALDRIRHRKVQHRSDEQSECFPDWSSPRGEINDPEKELLAREQTNQLLGLLQELPIKCQQVVSLHRLEGYSQNDVASRLGISARMVRRHVTYAMIYLHLRLDGMTVEQVRQRVSL